MAAMVKRDADISPSAFLSLYFFSPSFPRKSSRGPPTWPFLVAFSSTADPKGLEAKGIPGNCTYRWAEMAPRPDEVGKAEEGYVRVSPVPKEMQVRF